MEAWNGLGFSDEPELIDDWEEEACYGSGNCLADLMEQAGFHRADALDEDDDGWD